MTRGPSLGWGLIGASDIARTRMIPAITAHPDYFPLYTQDGRWRHEQEA